MIICLTIPPSPKTPPSAAHVPPDNSAVPARRVTALCGTGKPRGSHPAGTASPAEHGQAVRGYFAFDNYSDRQTNLEAAQAEASTQIEQQRILKDAVLEALKINGEKPPMIDEIETKASQAYEKALKPLSDADKVEIYSAGKESVLGNKELNEFIANPTPKLETSESTKILEIEGIKRSPEKLTVTCSERGSDISFTLYVDLSFINQTEVDILFDAFKKNKPVSVQGSYKERSGIIERANASTITVYQQN